MFPQGTQIIILNP